MTLAALAILALACAWVLVRPDTAVDRMRRHCGGPVPDQPSVGACDARAAAPAFPTDCPSCASERAQNARLSAAYLEIADTLRAVYAYLPECPPHVAARLRQILAGLDLACPACAARRVEERRG